MDVSTMLFDISKAAHRNGPFTKLIDEQAKYLKEKGRFPVCILITYDMLRTLVHLVVKDPVEANKTVMELSDVPRALFLFEGLPVYFNPRLRTVPAMVVAEPRFWRSPEEITAFLERAQESDS